MEIKKLFNLEIKWASRESKQSNNYLSDTPRPQYKTADEISWIQMHQQVQTKRKLFITWSKIASDVRMHITVIKNINCEILTVEVE